MKKKKKEKFIDDGRVVAPMNVDGMPWYTEGKNPSADKNWKEMESKEMTFGEKLAMMRGVLAAALLVLSVFGIGLFLFILFCVKVWFA